MRTTPEREQEKWSARRTGSESILPLAVRQRLWDQLWTRLLAPPVDAADKAPAPKNRGQRDGGQR